MSLDLGVAPGDSLTQLSSYLAANANELANEVDVFIGDLLTTREIDFADVGDTDSLSYLQWDYNQELQQLQTIAPGQLIFDDAELQTDIDSIGQLPAPTAPTLDLPQATMPSLDAERPIVSLPALPGTDVGSAPQDAPQITEGAAPDAPLVTLPAVPTFEELQIPAAPSYSLPTLAIQAPQNLLSAPTDVFSYVDAEYTSSLRDPLVAKLLYDLENGGYGIDANDELALFTRARDRAEQVGRLAVEESRRRAYDMSFPLPTGALFADLERARTALQAEISKANMEITLKRSDLYVENRKFTIQQVQEHERTSISLYNAIQERALNAAKASVELGIAVYEASVRNFQASLQAYETEARVFEARVRAELSKAELFKAQIQAEALRGEFNKQRADLYQAQINGVNSVVNLYKSRIEALAALTGVQGQKIEIFKSRVQAYATRVQAKAAEYDMYRAAVQGETAKLDIYRTDIAAYEAKIRAEEIRTRVLQQGNEALIKQYDARVTQYRSELEGATKRVDARTEHNRTIVAAHAANVGSYRALVDAVLSGVNTRVSSQKMNNDWNIAAINSKVKATEFRLEQLKLTVLNRTEIDKFGAKFFMDPITATMASLNGLSVKSA